VRLALDRRPLNDDKTKYVLRAKGESGWMLAAPKMAPSAEKSGTYNPLWFNQMKSTSRQTNELS
jgi:hypothetical protein